MQNHTIYLAFDEKCYMYTATSDIIICTEVNTYTCTHEEADTRLVFHLMKAIEVEPNWKFCVRCNDTDIIVLLLYHCSRRQNTPFVWMDVGLSGKNNRRYINIQQLLAEMQNDTVDSLPGLHAFTGCDFTASFYNKGKLRPLSIMMKNDRFQKAIGQLGVNDEVTDEIIDDLDDFVCTLYGFPNIHSVDDVRVRMFEQKYAPNNENDPLMSISGMHPYLMPPCHNVLLQKIKRANFVAKLWKSANQAVPIQSSPVGSGWLLEDNVYRIHWYEGDQVPRNLGQLVEGGNVLAEDYEADIDIVYESDSDDEATSDIDDDDVFT